MKKSDPTSTSSSEPSRLLTLLNVSQPKESNWMPGELGAILTHQLNVPLRDMIANTSDSRSVAQFLTDIDPDATVLASLKDSFKLASTRLDDALPKEVATVLYIAVLVVARRAGLQLTSLDDAALSDRVTWAKNRRWLDEVVREIFDENEAS